jgi:hypothetical protein
MGENDKERKNEDVKTENRGTGDKKKEWIKKRLQKKWQHRFVAKKKRKWAQMIIMIGTSKEYK